MNTNAVDPVQATRAKFQYGPTFPSQMKRKSYMKIQKEKQAGRVLLQVTENNQSQVGRALLKVGKIQFLKGKVQYLPEKVQLSVTEKTLLPVNIVMLLAEGVLRPVAMKQCRVVRIPLQVTGKILLLVRKLPQTARKIQPAGGRLIAMAKVNGKNVALSDIL